MGKAHRDVVQEGIGVFQNTNKTRRTANTQMKMLIKLAITQLHTYTAIIEYGLKIFVLKNIFRVYLCEIFVSVVITGFMDTQK